MGLTYTQIWSKMQILVGYAEFESFRLHWAGLSICRRVNFARLPRWQLFAAVL